MQVKVVNWLKTPPLIPRTAGGPGSFSLVSAFCSQRPPAYHSVQSEFYCVSERRRTKLVVRTRDVRILEMIHERRVSIDDGIV